MGDQPPAKKARGAGGDDVAVDSLLPPLPKRPQRFIESTVSTGQFRAGMQEVLKELSAESERRDAFYELCKALRVHAESAVRQLQEGNECDFVDARKAWSALATALSASSEFRSISSCSTAVATLIAGLCLAEFFISGKLLCRTSMHLLEFQTSEYILGVIRFADELASYAVGRAMFADVASVAACARIVNDLNAALMNFNFRNGPLRRRYDSVKYRVRKLENMLYELSLVYGTADINTKVGTSGLNAETFKAMAAEVDKESEDRDTLIKSCREPQKKSKNAIYALHRPGKGDEAAGLLKDVRGACSSIKALARQAGMPEGDLFSGSFGNVLEEYAEARIFQEWLVSGQLLPFDALKAEVDCRPVHYLGGVVDFTGELGRYGVALATKRDIEGVKTVLACSMAIKEYAIEFQQALPRLTKKVDAILTNTSKMENILYDLVLVTQSNRKTLDLASTNASEPKSEE